MAPVGQLTVGTSLRKEKKPRGWKRPSGIRFWKLALLSDPNFSDLAKTNLTPTVYLHIINMTHRGKVDCQDKSKLKGSFIPKMTPALIKQPLQSHLPCDINCLQRCRNIYCFGCFSTSALRSMEDTGFLKCQRGMGA